ncbi:MAG TPA: serine/threonine-protein kinase, partial [Kofleriaceae bacterium]
YPHVAANPDLVAMFIDEARLARYLKHPNIARVFEFGRISGTYFIAFEYVQGPTVQQLARQCDTAVGYMPIPIVLEIGIQICDALRHAHNLCDEEGLPLGIVHRDVSPQNLIVANSGFVKLIDFGLAKAKQSSVESQSGIIKGKLHYTAPEYLDGALDVRCDLWAVGVVLHELLTGNRLFDAAENFAMIDQVRNKAIPPASRSRAEVTSALDDILFRALERNPAKRWQTAASLRAALVAHAKEFPLVTRSQLVTWVEWAFAQKQKMREDSGLSALSEIIESAQIQSIYELRALETRGNTGASPVITEETEDAETIDEAATRLPASAAAVEERRRESIKAMPVGDGMLKRRKQEPLWPWLVGLATLVVLLVAVLVKLGVIAI